MKDRIAAAKQRFNQNADVIVYSMLTAGIAIGGILVGYDLAKRKTTNDLRVIGATSYENLETGEDSPLYLTHRNGSISTLKPRPKKQ